MALTMDSTVAELFDDPKVFAFLEENFPELVNHPNLAMAKAMPFNVVAGMAQSQGRMSGEDCDKIEEFLKTL